VLEAIFIGVAVVVVSTLIIGGFKLLWTRREATRQTIRERTCRHEWEPINKPGESVVLITADDEWCVKCGARR
jgi:hypothetical protein